MLKAPKNAFRPDVRSGQKALFEFCTNQLKQPVKTDR